MTRACILLVYKKKKTRELPIHTTVYSEVRDVSIIIAITNITVIMDCKTWNENLYENLFSLSPSNPLSVLIFPLQLPPSVLSYIFIHFHIPFFPFPLSLLIPLPFFPFPLSLKLFFSSLPCLTFSFSPSISLPSFSSFPFSPSPPLHTKR